MKFFLDEGAPRQIGEELIANGFEVIFFSDAAQPGTPDNVVADIAVANQAILVAIDRDMREIAKARGVSKKGTRSLAC